MKHSRKTIAWVVASLLLLSVVVFRASLGSEQTVSTQDFNISTFAVYKSIFPQDMFHGSWGSSGNLGPKAIRSLTLTNFLVDLLPLEFFADWIYPIYLSFSSLCLMGFLRLRGVGWGAAFTGALVAYWTGSNLTLVYPGHLFKYGTLFFASLTLLCMEKAAGTRKFQWSLGAAGAFAFMFQEQQDLAVFFGVLLGPYFLHALVRDHGWKPAVLLRTLLPFALLAGAMMWNPYERTKTGIIDQSSVAASSPEEKWGWATQWSWPPEETIDFIAPGYMGWKNQDPEGPYRGRMGQSPDFPQTGQGFPNFKLESQYIGLLPILLMAFGFWSGCRRSGNSQKARRDVLFWTLAVGVLFCLALGKYFFLYRGFYHLPLMSSIRNPNKFLQVLQVAMGILTAFGANALLGSAREKMEGSLSVAALKKWVWGMYAVPVMLLIAWMAVSLGKDSFVLELQRSYGKAAGTLASLRAGAMGHAFLISLIAVTLFKVALHVKRFQSPVARTRLLVGINLVICVDVLLMSSHYLEPTDLSSTVKNPLGEYLAGQVGEQRVAALTPQGVYNHLIGKVLPYYDVPTSNVLAAPRLGSDYDLYFKAIGQNVFRLWTQFGVSHVLAPTASWKQMLANPAFATAFEPVFSWSEEVAVDRRSFRVVPMALESGARHVVLRYKNGLPRFRLVHDWKVASSDQEVLDALKDPRSLVDQSVFLQPAPDQAPPPAPEPGDSPGSVSGEKDINGFELAVETPRPALVVFSDRFGPDLSAWVDGTPAPVYRTNHLFLSVPVPAGKHSLEIRYTPATASLRVFQAGAFTWLIALIWGLFPPRKSTEGTAS